MSGTNVLQLDRRQFSYLLIFCLVLVFFQANSASGIQVGKDILESPLEAAHDLWRFDGVVLIAEEGKVLFSQGYGLANLVFAATKPS